jgi:hypothetical protein
MRLVVIDAKKGTCNVFEGRVLVAMYKFDPAWLPNAEQVEEIRLATPTPVQPETA